jgi:hypothetical protein
MNFVALHYGKQTIGYAKILLLMTGLYHKTDNNSVSLEESLCEQHLTIVP